ncbi:MAG TPA: hypothetical protein VFZ16_10800, partial [Hyphomicrobiaceae bacterium]|nr:hypothetical protein [Hyphomicrobiaceae bacterium]
MFARVLFLLLALLIGQLAGASPSLAEGPRSPPADDKVEELDPSHAEQPTAPLEVKSKLAAEVAAILGKASAALSETVKALRGEPTASELSELRTRVEEVLDSTAAVADRLGPRLAAVKSQIEKLGPVPGPKDPAEAPAVAAERTRLI